MRTPANLWRPSTRTCDPLPTAWDYGQEAAISPPGPSDISRAVATHTVARERIDDRVLIFFCQALLRKIDLCAQRSTRTARSVPIPKVQRIC